MPPHTKFTQDIILDEAFEIVRQESLDVLSARRIAKELGCSTQPVYDAYASMQELQDAVIEKAKKYALDYFSQPGDPGSTSPFLSLGLRYFQFSQEEKTLFKLLFLDGLIGISLENFGSPFRSLLGNLKDDPRLEGLSEESLKRLGSNMWIYLHGLTALIYKNPPARAGDFIKERLMQMGKTLIEWERQQST
ncbi:MAG: TetR/AcrR family transcriptional regulator [Chloroflexi bacterium]|nr:MAG: TetR/AcrR family transcriptional regulator [Chloroflexota bacterium]